MIALLERALLPAARALDRLANPDRRRHIARFNGLQRANLTHYGDPVKAPCSRCRRRRKLNHKGRCTPCEDFLSDLSNELDWA